MTSSPPTYLDVELALSQIGDVEAMNGMMVMLQEALVHDIPAIADHLQVGDIASANRLLHGIKGFVPIFCQDAFCSRVVQVEAMSKDSQSTTVTAAYTELRPELDQLLADVTAYLASAGQSV